MLHTFAAGTWNIYEQQLRYVAHARTHHFEYVPGQLEAIDRAARRIHLRLATTMPWGGSAAWFLQGWIHQGPIHPSEPCPALPTHQLSLHGPGRAALLWLAQPITALVQPDICIS
jgi:hypothetical protein